MAYSEDLKNSYDLFRVWLAGFVDGEGCFHIDIPTGPRLTLSQNGRRGEKIMEQIKLRYGGSIYVDGNDNWRYTAAAQQLRGLLPDILPHLRIKYQEALVTRQYLKLSRLPWGTRTGKVSREPLVQREKLVEHLRSLR